MSRNNAGLSTERIVTEALRIIDGQGLSRLTMRRLGDALQVEAMAIYHHFPLGKEQLFDAIVEHMTDVTRSRSSPEDDEATSDAAEEAAQEGELPWDERLRVWAHDYRAALLRHSGALALLINRRPDTTAALRSLEAHYAAFQEAGLSGAAVAHAAAVLDSYVTGAVIHQARAESAATPEAPQVLDGRYPHVAALGEIEPDHARRFSEGLEAVLAGVRAHLAS
ncbi:TetR/AcrR family transcriptional regulator [Salinactinospora qingdaonensis]|uniref:TetR/AcrR family transcriptional regulator C-terminal domain-containing protein n=1 Tax=Salinactinospora qingdaonensis TaxID=702744 RepID=A0ABP7F4B8_9ACTN